MAKAGLDVTVAFGGRPFREVPFKGVTLRAAARRDHRRREFLRRCSTRTGTPVDEPWKDARRDALLELFATTEPDVVLIELYPFGRRQFRFELVPLLEADPRRKRRGRASPARCATSWSPPRARAATRDGGDAAPLLRRRAGARRPGADPLRGDLRGGRPHRRPDPLYRLCRAAGDDASLRRGRPARCWSRPAAARSARRCSSRRWPRGPLTALAGHVWRFLTGPNLGDDDFQALAALASDAHDRGALPADFAERLRDCGAVDLAGRLQHNDGHPRAPGARAVVVPYETKGETEQRLRAEILAAQGAADADPGGGAHAGADRRRRCGGARATARAAAASTLPARPRPRASSASSRRSVRHARMMNRPQPSPAVIASVNNSMAP